MVKKLICLIVVAAAAMTATAVEAEDATGARPDLTVSHPHEYWLSDGLNRLVFWQAPLQSGRSAARTPQDGASVGTRSGG